MATLYTLLAESLEEQLRSGVFQANEKLPSLRKFAEQRSVSISTAQMAYNQLEDRGLIEVRPKSGYYVRHISNVQFETPKIKVSPQKPNIVTTSELVMDVMRNSGNPNYVNFAAASPGTDFPILQQVKKSFTQTARNRDFLGNGYCLTKGEECLRRALAQRANDAGIRITPEEIIISSGCQSAIGLCLKVLCKPGDIVAVESPSYYGLLQLIESMGLKVIELPSDPVTGLSVDALRLALEQWPVKTILGVPNYNNPLGAVMPIESKKAVIELINQYQISFIEDDIYGELGYDESRPPAVKAYDSDGRVLLCSSASKMLEPQLGVGWIMPGQFMKEIEYERFLSSSNQFCLPQIVIGETMAKASFDRHIRQARKTYQQRRDRLFDLISAHFPENIRVSTPQGGFVAWIELPRSLDATDLYLRAKEVGIVISPGAIFSSNPSKYKHSIRLSYAQAWTKERDQAIQTLGNLINATL
jgi:DNA-binding transcriptional MocR family regulator